MKFFFGTTNPYKIRELASILNPLGIPLEVTDPIDPEETGDTFEGNAKIKAVEYGRHVGQSLIEQVCLAHGCGQQKARDHLRLSRQWVVCEDSGIDVPELGGLPGPWSARFSDCLIDPLTMKVIGHQESGRCREEIDDANNRLVLHLMKGMCQPYRAAAFVVCLMVADTDGQVLFQTTSRKTGWLLTEPRGQDGFGYDPVFASDDSFGRSWAEIDSMRKNLISHRRRALQDFTAWLAVQLKKPGA